MLNKMGARISGAGTDVITIEGVDELQPVEHAIIPDRIEAGTLLVAAAITGGDVLVQRAVPEHLEAVIEKLREAGCKVTVEADGMRLSGPQRRARRSTSSTQEHPGFPTDMQAQFMALLATATGTSRHHRDHLREPLHARRRAAPHGRRHRGRRPHGGGARRRAALGRPGDGHRPAGLGVAGAGRAGAPRGATTVSRVYHLDRGYERLETKLKALGADIRRVKSGDHRRVEDSSDGPRALPLIEIIRLNIACCFGQLTPGTIRPHPPFIRSETTRWSAPAAALRWSISKVTTRRFASAASVAGCGSTLRISTACCFTTTSPASRAWAERSTPTHSAANAPNARSISCGYRAARRSRRSSTTPASPAEASSSSQTSRTSLTSRRPQKEIIAFFSAFSKRGKKAAAG